MVTATEGLALAAVAGTAAALGFGTASIRTRNVDDGSSIPVAVNRAFTVGVAAGVLVVVPFVFLLETVHLVGPPAVLDAEGGTPGGLLGSFADVLILVYPAQVAALGAWYRNHRTSEDVEPATLRRMVIFTTLFSATLVGFLLVVGALRGPALALFAALAPLGLLVLFVGALPGIFDLLNETRQPTADERRAIEAGVEPAGVDPEDVPLRVIETPPHSDLMGMKVLGFRGRRTVFVTDAFFEAFDAERRSVLAAMLGASMRSWHREYRTLVAGLLSGGVATVAVLLLDGSLFGFVLLFLVVLLALGAWLVASLVGRWLIYRGDEHLAQVVGRDRYVDALSSLAQRPESDIPFRMRVRYMMPSLDRRLGRLREEDEVGAPDPPFLTDQE